MLSEKSGEAKSKESRYPLLVILGPTAVGKSEVALEAADLLDGEIISGDSMQVYKHMDIGTAKLRPSEHFSTTGKYIPHHLLDLIEPDEQFSVAQFQKEVRKLVPEILKRGKLPIIVGGTGLYINSLIKCYDFPNLPQSTYQREKLKHLKKTYGLQYLYNILSRIDPVSASRIHPHDTQRIIRALEVFYTSGKPFSEFSRRKKKDTCFDYVLYGLTMKREELYRRINRRVDEMIERGFIREVRALIAKYDVSLKPLQAIGYKHIILYLEGKYSLEEAIRLIKRDTRRFAKRQYTWFTRNREIIWLNVESYQNSREIAREIACGPAGQLKSM